MALMFFLLLIIVNTHQQQIVSIVRQFGIRKSQKKVGNLRYFLYLYI